MRYASEKFRPNSRRRRLKISGAVQGVGFRPFVFACAKLFDLIGGELKATFCAAKNEFAFISQHIGDMENLETLHAFEKSVEQMRKLFRIEPEIVAFDKHPNYLSARWAKENSNKIFQPNVKLVAVQHHHAHIASVMAENNNNGAERVIGFAFDGTSPSR